MSNLQRLQLVASLALAAAVVVLVAGCGGSNPNPPGTLDRADYYAARGKRLEAVAAYEAFVRHNPTDSLAAEAQFRKAMVYMDLEEYPLAAVEFQILRKDFPTSERVEEATFQEGLSYLRQVGNVERDASGAYEAREHFLRFKESYPQSTRLAAVDAELTKISDIIVRKRLAQVEVFRQLKRWKAVATVLDGVIADEGGSSLLPQALWERAEAAERLGEPAVAATYFQRLAESYPQDRRAEAAAASVARLRAAAGS